MTNLLIDQLNTQRTEQVEYIDHLMSSAASENRELVETEQRSIDTASEIIARLDKQLEPIVKFENVRASAHVIDGRLQQRAATRTSPRPLSDSGFITPDGFESFGDLYTASEDFQSRGALGTRLELNDVHAYNLAAETRAVLTTGGTPGSNLLPRPERWFAPQAELVTPLLDMIPKVPVTTGSVDIVTYGQEVTGGDVVAEGGDKPEGTIVTAVTPTPLETVAVWVQYSRQLAADAPAVAALLNSGMTRGILRKLNSLIQAVIAAASITTKTGSAGQNLLQVARTAMADIEAAGYTPNAILGSPSLLADLDLSLLALGGANATNANGGVWGLKRIPVPGLSSLYVMDVTDALVLFQRTGVEMYTTDSDITGAGTTAKSAFRSNILTTLAETRAKAAVVNTAAARKLAPGA